MTVTAATTGTPTASFVFSPTAPTTTTMVQFNAGVTTMHAFAAAGIFNVALTVTDSAGDTGTTSSQVTVIATTAGEPTASFVFSPPPPPPTAVQFNGTASTAPAGLILATHL